MSHAGRHAFTVGHDETRSGKVPIVSARIKAMSQRDAPVVLRVHEAPCVKNSNVTLISEHQVRENGIAIDSVSRRHKNVNGTFGTQRMILSEHFHVPFVDRGGLLGHEMLPWKEGDEFVCDFFDITGDIPWKSRRFCDDDDASVTASNARSAAASTDTSSEPTSDEPTSSESPFKFKHAPSRHSQSHAVSMISEARVPACRGAHEVGPGKCLPFDRGKWK